MARPSSKIMTPGELRSAKAEAKKEVAAAIGAVKANDGDLKRADAALKTALKAAAAALAVAQKVHDAEIKAAQKAYDASAKATAKSAAAAAKTATKAQAKLDALNATESAVKPAVKPDLKLAA